MRQIFPNSLQIGILQKITWCKSTVGQVAGCIQTRDITRDRRYDFVGLGTFIAMRMYELARSEFPAEFEGFIYPMPSSGDILAAIDRMGGFASPKTLGVTPQTLYQSFFHATHANGRYTLISYLEGKSALERYAGRITREVFDGAAF